MHTKRLPVCLQGFFWSHLAVNQSNKKLLLYLKVKQLFEIVGKCQIQPDILSYWPGYMVISTEFAPWQIQSISRNVLLFVGPLLETQRTGGLETSGQRAIANIG